MIGKWIFQQFARLQIFLYRRSGGKTMGIVRAMPVLLLTSIGRKTGKQRVTPVMYIQYGDNYVITASNAGFDANPGWFLNLQAHPQTTIEVGGKTIRVMARKASLEEKGRLWAELVKQAPFFEDYQKKATRDIPMVILQPTGGSQPAG